MGLPKSGLASESNLHFFMISKYCENLREFLCAVFAKTKFEVLDIHYMETGIQYMEVNQNVEPFFSKTKQGNSLKFFTVILTNQDLLILI